MRTTRAFLRGMMGVVLALAPACKDKDGETTTGAGTGSTTDTGTGTTAGEPTTGAPCVAGRST